jgi:lipopolysaccharide transport system permease protein
MPQDSFSHDILIEPQTIQKQYLKDLIRYHELFYFLAWRDILVRYKQAFFGVAWAIIRPLLNMILFTFLFSNIAHLSSNNVNYSVFVLAGMLPWQLFSTAVVDTSNCLLNNAHLISKVYFPRMIIPAAQIVVNFVDFLIGLALLMLLIPLTSGFGSWQILCFPLFVLLLLALTLGVSLWISASTVLYRDIRFIVPFAVQLGMFLSPVGYGSFMISEKWRMLYSLNPFVGIINGFRWSLFGMSEPDFLFSCMISIGITLFILLSGFIYFRRIEVTFADKI